MKRGVGLLVLGLIYSQVPVTIETVPPGAEVLIDGQSAGNSPLKEYPMAVGRHGIKVILEGWAPAEKELEIQPARAGKIQFRLRPLLKILFHTKERGLTYSFDNRYTWKKKRVEFYVEKGMHVLQVKKGDEVIEERIFDFRTNQELNFSIKKDEK